MTFIDKIAKHINEQGLPLSNLSIIIPSERAKKYLSSALFREYNRPIIAPEMKTMDQWVKSLSSETVIDNTRVLIQLFEIQLKNAKTEEDRSFDEFLTWGNILLSDFNEIDRYLLEANDVFKNLADIKEIEQWSFDSEKLTPSQERFMEFWDRLPGYYYELNNSLSQQGSCYTGRAYRNLANNINVLFEKDPSSRFLFVGFNAMSKSEMSIIRQLDKLGRADMIIDADAYYFDNESHEAGTFLRKQQKAFDGRKMNFIQNNLATKNIKVEMIECTQNTGQVKVAATILERSTKEDIDATLLLLADESLIGAIIKNLPKKIEKANITLGLPIKNSAVRTWVELLFSIQENKKRFATKAIYFNDLQSFWNHPFVLAIVDVQEKEQLLEVEKIIIRRNQIFLNPNPVKIKKGDNKEPAMLGKNTQVILDLLTKDWNYDWKIAIRIIRELNTLIYSGLQKEFAYEKAIIECFDRALIDIENIIEEGIPEMSMKSFKQLFNQHWWGQSVAYYGNPIDALQIMGLLETRALDFKRIICVGMNEGQLPTTNPIQTMIPMDLRRYLELPTPREKQGLFAHHFYRLLHACEELYVTYCSADDTIGSNEPSRYLMQLEMELSRTNKNVEISKKIYSLEQKKQTMFKEIKKTNEIQNRMDFLFEKSASASMFKKYLTCPLDFYFKYIMDFGEADSVEEEIENSTFGTFIHKTLEELYKEFARLDSEGTPVSPTPKKITIKDIHKMLENFEAVLHSHFMEHFNNDADSFMKGKNLLSYKMAIELTERFLKSEVKFLSQQTEPVFIEALEQEYESTIEIEVNGTKKNIKLRGIIDRIDRVGDKVRIIDYKSGRVQENDTKFRVKDCDEESIVASLAGRKHILQLIQYAFLYHQKYQEIPESGIISFISGDNMPFILDTQKVELEEVIKNYPLYIGRVLGEMYDDSIPFKHNTTQFVSYCQYCN
jgi:RecB family exonuclease